MNKMYIFVYIKFISCNSFLLLSMFTGGRCKPKVCNLVRITSRITKLPGNIHNGSTVGKKPNQGVTS